jgi:hypothetical protein
MLARLVAVEVAHDAADAAHGASARPRPWRPPRAQAHVQALEAEAPVRECALSAPCARSRSRWYCTVLVGASCAEAAGRVRVYSTRGKYADARHSSSPRRTQQSRTEHTSLFLDTSYTWGSNVNAAVVTASMTIGTIFIVALMLHEDEGK